MYLFHILRSFLPLRNPIGFGASDLVVLAAAIMLTTLVIATAYLLPWLHRLAARPRLCFGLLFILPVGLRLLLLIHNPVPIGSGADDFSYLLLSDTLSHGRLANPSHPLHQFFEAVFVLQQPAYASIYPLGQGLVLALGQLLFHCPWAGVLLSGGLFSMLCYWMLRGWVAPIYSLCGGLLATIQLGPLCSWMNSYWGGYVSACAGCLVFGAMPRLVERPSKFYGALLGLGLSLELLTRPFETILLCFAVVLYLTFQYSKLGTSLVRPVAVTIGITLTALGLTALQNRAVTNSWLTLPYVLSRADYGVPTTFTFQPNPIPQHPLTAEQELDYRAQSAIHGPGTETLASYLDRLLYRVRYLRFFLLPPLYFAAGALVFRMRDLIYPACVVALFAFGVNFYPYFFPHYIAVLACVFILLGVQGLRSFSRMGRQYIPILCVSYFGFWFLLFLARDGNLLRALSFESWNYVNPADPQGRADINAELHRYPGKELVFVHYSSTHRFAEWIHNSAGIDASKTIWANDLGAEENRRLIDFYPERKVWILEPDAHPPKLSSYVENAPASLVNVQ